MRSSIKITKTLMFGLLIIGGAYSTVSCVSVTETSSSQSQNSALWHDGSKGGEYGIGEGWSVEILPPEYETFTENFVVHEGIELITVPATFEWVKEDSEILKAPRKMETELITIPAEYETITEKVLARKSSTEYYFTDPIFNSDGTLKKPRKVKQRHVPAQMKNVSRRVVKVPARTVERAVRLAPLVKRNGYVRVMKTPAMTTERDVPDVIRTRTKRREKHPWQYAVRNPDGSIAHIFDTFEGLTTFIDSLSQQLGEL